MSIGRADEMPLEDDDEEDDDEDDDDEAASEDESSELDDTLDTSSFSLEDACGSAITNACTCSDSS